MGEETTTNGALFDLDVITDLIVPFEFEFEGHTLRGKWYKYKTTTPDWALERVERYNEKLQRFQEVQKQRKATKDTRLQKKLDKELKQLSQEATRARFDWLADAIVEWNATSKGVPIPVSDIKLHKFPVPFMELLCNHLEADRAAANPTSSAS